MKKKLKKINPKSTRLARQIYDMVISQKAKKIETQFLGTKILKEKIKKKSKNFKKNLTRAHPVQHIKSVAWL
jgi:hypothetical protein